MSRNLVFIVIIAATLGLYFYRAKFALKFYEQQARLRVKLDPLNDLQDGLHAVICGSGSPLPDEERAGPCTLVVAGKRMFIVDSGSSSSRKLVRMGFKASDIEAVLLTHFHSDHIDGLGELMLQRWVGSQKNSVPLTIYGPQGVNDVVEGFNKAYAQDKVYRVQHHGEKFIIPSSQGGKASAFTIGESYSSRVVVFKDEDLEVVAFKVKHDPIKPAVGYKFTYRGLTLVISGDTTRIESVEREAKDVDLLLHEGLSIKMVKMLEDAFVSNGNVHLAKIMSDIPDYHTDPDDVASLASDIGAKELVFHHIVPVLPNIEAVQQGWLGEARNLYKGRLTIALDGDVYSILSKDKPVIHSHLSVKSPAPPILPIITFLLICLVIFLFYKNNQQKNIINKNKISNIKDR